MVNTVIETQATKKEQLIQDLGQMQLLGEIVTWSLRENRGTKNKYSEVINALQVNGLDEKIARSFLPAQAFNRACTALKEQRIIDVIRNDKEDILFQFSKKQITEDKDDGGQELEYRKEAKVLLNKSTGELKCKDPVVLEQAKKELDRCLEERNTSDISHIVTKLFESNADLIPIGLGVFFVPQTHSSFVDKIHAFLLMINRKLSRFPIPEGTQNGDKSVQDAMCSHFDSMISDLRESINKFTPTTRDGTIEGTAEKITTTRMKIEAYASYLQDKSQELLEAIDSANNELVEKLEEIAEQDKQNPVIREGSMRQKVYNAITTEPKTIKEICELAGAQPGGMSTFLEELVDKGSIIKVENKYAKRLD